MFVVVDESLKSIKDNYLYQQKTIKDYITNRILLQRVKTICKLIYFIKYHKKY